MLKTQIKETNPEYNESTLDYLEFQLSALEKIPQPEQFIDSMLPVGVTKFFNIDNGGDRLLWLLFCKNDFREI